MDMGYGVNATICQFYWWRKAEKNNNWNIVESGFKYHNSNHNTKICQWFLTDWWFSPLSSTNKTDRHDKTETDLSQVTKKL
jgi:hypothetical protein